MVVYSGHQLHANQQLWCASGASICIPSNQRMLLCVMELIVQVCPSRHNGLGPLRPAFGSRPQGFKTTERAAMVSGHVAVDQHKCRVLFGGFDPVGVCYTAFGGKLIY